MLKTRIFATAALAVLAFGATSVMAQDQGGQGGGMGAGRGGGMFGRYDADHDGKVSLAEYEAGRMMQFNRMDADHDGKLSFAEIDAASAQAAQRGGPMADMMKQRNDALKVADSNGDQSISADEFKAYADAEFKKLDANNDGFLTEDEMPQMGRRRQ